MIEHGVPAKSDRLTPAFPPLRLSFRVENCILSTSFSDEPTSPESAVVGFLEAIDIAKPKSDIETLWESSGFLRQSVS